MAKNDIRLDIAMVNHPKTKRMIRVLGYESFYSLISLFSSAAQTYTKGILKNCDEYDIADMACWNGDPCKFVETLASEKIGFLDFDGEEYSIHDWEKNQPWIYHSEERSETARKNVQKRWDVKKKNVQNEYKDDTDGKENDTNGKEKHQFGNTPIPIPIPTPTPTPTPIPTPIPTLRNKEQVPYVDVINHLNEKLGKNYRSTSAKTKSLIKARFKESFTLDDFKTVIDKKTKEWKGSEMEKFLRPETLFGTKFEGYLNQEIIVKKVGTEGYGLGEDW